MHPMIRLFVHILIVVTVVTAAFSSGASHASTPAQPEAYDVENRSIVSSGGTRTFVLSIPNPRVANLPLVFSLHGDGGNGAGMRAALPLEAPANSGAVFVYPNAPGGTFEYYSDLGRTREVQFVRDVIDALEAELTIDRTRVFITGFSGGATMANALGCRMQADEIRALGINSGSLYPINDFTYTGNGGVSCALPATMFVWGVDDETGGVSYTTGQAVRNNHLATQNCAATTTPRDPAPCVNYDSCQRDVAWCAIPGMGHSIWNQAATAIWGFFAAQTPAPPATTLTVYDETLQNGFQNFSWGTVDFNHMTQPHNGAKTILFTAHSFQGLSFARPAEPISVAAYPELRFWIRGDVGNENFNISLQSGATLHADVALNQFIVGGAVAAGAYREVRVRFADAPISYSGSFERINIQDSSGNAVGNPQIVRIDDVVLIGSGGTAGGDFANGFEDTP
jgi:poly(3-hydroxybutyrate) depolymerase